MESTMNRGLKRLRWPVLAVVAVGGVATLALLEPSEAQSDRDADRSLPAFAAPAGGMPVGGMRSFADVIEQVSPAVVNISVVKLARPVPTAAPSRRGSPSPFDEFFGQFFGVPGFGAPGIPGRSVPPRTEGQGSGFIVDAEGFVATNNHVIDGAEQIVVTLSSGIELDAEVVGRDPQTDIALLRIDTANAALDSALPELRFGDSDRTRVGDWVLAIGNPFGLGGSATAGIVSARGRDIASGPYDDYLQIDAPINSGNSGGPVFNAAGEVIGINTAIYTPNGGNIGIGFAIPSNQASQILDQLKAGGTVTRGWLGVQIQSIDEGIAGVLGLDEAVGALVSEVVELSPAADGGLEVGDVVVSVDGQRIESPRDLARTVAMHDAGERVDVNVIRNGRERTLRIELGERSAEDTVAQSSSGRSDGDGSVADELGLTLDDLNARSRARLGLDPDIRGAIVAAVRPGSEAARRGIRPGDVIVSVNRAKTPDAGAALDALARARSSDEQALVLLRRGDGQHFVALGLA